MSGARHSGRLSVSGKGKMPFDWNKVGSHGWEAYLEVGPQAGTCFFYVLNEEDPARFKWDVTWSKDAAVLRLQQGYTWSLEEAQSQVEKWFWNYVKTIQDEWDDFAWANKLWQNVDWAEIVSAMKDPEGKE